MQDTHTHTQVGVHVVAKKSAEEADGCFNATSPIPNPKPSCMQANAVPEQASAPDD